MGVKSMKDVSTPWMQAKLYGTQTQNAFSGNIQMAYDNFGNPMYLNSASFAPQNYNLGSAQLNSNISFNANEVSYDSKLLKGDEVKIEGLERKEIPKDEPLKIKERKSSFNST